MMRVNPSEHRGPHAVASEHGDDRVRDVRPSGAVGGALLPVVWQPGRDRARRLAGGAPRRHGPVRRPRRLHHARRAPRPGERQALRRVLLRAARGRHRDVRWPRRQAARRRHRRPVRRAGRPRGRRRAGGAGRSADAGDAGPVRRRRAGLDESPIEMRVGINTGEVLVGTLAGTDYTAMGDVVNTASRLQSMAPPGRVLVGSATAALCSAAIDREPFGVTQIRGRDQIEQSWLVTGAAAAGTRPRPRRRAVRRPGLRAGAARRGRRAGAQRPQRCGVDRRRGRRRQDPPGRRDRRPTGGRGDRRPHGVRPVRRSRACGRR